MHARLAVFRGHFGLNGELARIGIVAQVRRQFGADGEKFQLDCSCVDDLVRRALAMNNYAGEAIQLTACRTVFL